MLTYISLCSKPFLILDNKGLQKYKSLPDVRRTLRLTSDTRLAARRSCLQYRLLWAPLPQPCHNSPNSLIAFSHRLTRPWPTSHLQTPFCAPRFPVGYVTCMSRGDVIRAQAMCISPLCTSFYGLTLCLVCWKGDYS